MEYPQSNLMPADFLEQLVSLIRVAKHDAKQLYAGYSESNIERVKYMSNMALALSRDVLCGMENFRIVIQPSRFHTERTGHRRRSIAALEIRRQGCFTGSLCPHAGKGQYDPSGRPLGV